MKFGGASVQAPDSFEQVAALVYERRQKIKEIVVVVSAMGDTTDQLLTLAHSVHPNPPKRELDMLLSVGERISASLLAMALYQRGCPAKSFTGSQSGILTSEKHTDASIVSMRPERLLPHLERGEVVVVAGFQGVSREKEITTLGRGGSDTTAVAIALALGYPIVEFYKDVDGIYTRDPHLGDPGERLPHLTYEEALALAERASHPFLHPRALALAARNELPLSFRSFLSPFVQEGGSWVGPKERRWIQDPCYEE